MHPLLASSLSRKLKSLTVASALARREKGQNRVAVVQTSKVLTTQYYGINFRQVFVLLRTLRFMCPVRLDATSWSHSSISWQLNLTSSRPPLKTTDRRQHDKDRELLLFRY